MADKNLGSVRYFSDRVPHAGQKKRISQPDGFPVEGQAEGGTRGSGNHARHQQNSTREHFTGSRGRALSTRTSLAR